MTDRRPTPDWEAPLPTLTGRAWIFGLRLTAADMLPARFHGESPAATRAAIFSDLDPTLGGRIGPGDVIVAEEQSGDEVAARAALAALSAAGVVALVAAHFAPAIEPAALGAGIVAVTVDAPAFIHTGDRLRIDLEQGKVVNLSSGDRAAIRNLSDAHRAAIRRMIDARSGAG